MKIKVGTTVETEHGPFVIRHINRSMKPGLVYLTEKYKPISGKKMYVRENNLEYSFN